MVRKVLAWIAVVYGGYVVLYASVASHTGSSDWFGDSFNLIVGTLLLLWGGFTLLFMRG